MNIDNVKTSDLPTAPVFVAIFMRQHDLELKYNGIEQKNGFYYPPLPRPHIDDAQFQHWIKGMFWRTHEEVSEALETIPDLEGDWKSRWDGDSDLRHFFEELSDALHFLTAVSITVGIDPLAVQHRWEKIAQDSLPISQPEIGVDDDEAVIYFAGRFSFALGLAANALKNKPWKSTQMTTDENRFRQLLMDSWDRFHRFWIELHCTIEDVWQLYHKKNMVNQFRQETRY